MIRVKTPVVLSGAVRAPQRDDFFTSGTRTAVGIVDGSYVKTALTVAQADETLGFTVQPGSCVVQSNGAFTNLSGFVPNTKVLLTADPDDASKVCWLLRCASTDADTAGTGSKRTEFAATTTGSNQIVVGSPFLFGIATRLAEDWGGTTDKQIICQIHGGVSVSPVFAIVVSGDSVYVDIRSGTTVSPRSHIPYAGEIGVAWDKWVVSGELHPTQGRLRVSRNGETVVDYAGPFGYADSEAAAYIKCGIYHWAFQNAWDMSVPDRGLYTKGFWQVDATLVSSDALSAFVEAL